MSRLTQGLQILDTSLSTTKKRGVITTTSMCGMLTSATNSCRQLNGLSVEILRVIEL